MFEFQRKMKKKLKEKQTIMPILDWKQYNEKKSNPISDIHLHLTHNKYLLNCWEDENKIDQFIWRLRDSDTGIKMLCFFWFFCNVIGSWRNDITQRFMRQTKAEKKNDFFWNEMNDLFMDRFAFIVF